MMKLKKEGDQSSMIESLISQTPEAILGTGSAEMIVNTSAPKEVQAVQKSWNVEMKAQAEAANRELELLRLRHIQDLEEAKAAGVSDTVLIRLREEHEDELRLMQEQNQLLKEELVKQRERDEAQALLSSAISATHHADGSGTNVVGSGIQAIERQKDDARISEMVVHLTETCQNKDEVLVRLFDLINLREAEIRDYEVNAQAIATAQADDSLHLLQDTRNEMINLRGEIIKKDVEINRLRQLNGQPALAVSQPYQFSPQTNKLLQRQQVSPGQQRSYSSEDFTAAGRYQSGLTAANQGAPMPKQQQFSSKPATQYGQQQGQQGGGQYNQQGRPNTGMGQQALSPSAMGRGSPNSGQFSPSAQYGQTGGYSTNQYGQQQQGGGLGMNNTSSGFSPSQQFGQQQQGYPRGGYR
jgi:hypothetical protein